MLSRGGEVDPLKHRSSPKVDGHIDGQLNLTDRLTLITSWYEKGRARETIYLARTETVYWGIEPKAVRAE